MRMPSAAAQVTGHLRTSPAEACVSDPAAPFSIRRSSPLCGSKTCQEASGIRLSRSATSHAASAPWPRPHRRSRSRRP